MHKNPAEVNCKHTAEKVDDVPSCAAQWQVLNADDVARLVW